MISVALTLVAVGAGFAIGRSTDPTARPSADSTTTAASAHTTVPVTTISTTTTTAIPGVDVGPFAGTWYHHGIVMDIFSTGYGNFGWRTYTDCGTNPPPCDYSMGNNIIDGGYALFGVTASGPTSASGHVFETNSGQVVPIGAFTVAFDPADDMIFVALANGQELAMCGPNARQPASNQCGA